MSPTIHVQLYPTTLPPANLDREAEKRSFHRRRSTRRLEAARGTTPLFLDLDSKRDLMTDSPTSPRTRAVRRKGQLFNSPTSTMSTESGYLFSNAREQSDDSDLQLHSPSSLCSVSSLTAGNPVTHGNNIKAGNTRAKTKTGPQQLAQPFLLQLRSLPVPLIKPSNPAATINSKSLSPTSSCFNMLSTTTSSHPPCDLSFDAKQRKLAKLQRFLGENIPPELVFPSSTTTSTTPLQRSTSVLESGSRGKVSHKPTRSISTSKTPAPLAAVPSRAATTPTTPQFQSTREPRTDVEQLPTARPQSMTTVPSPTMATMATPSTRGASLDGSTNNPPFQNVIEPETTPADQRRYRKEGKGWSGEWNVKDMEQVANALRGLKAR